MRVLGSWLLRDGRFGGLLGSGILRQGVWGVLGSWVLRVGSRKGPHDVLRVLGSWLLREGPAWGVSLGVVS